MSFGWELQRALKQHGLRLFVARIGQAALDRAHLLDASRAKYPTHSVHSRGFHLEELVARLDGVVGHSRSQAPQLMQSAVMYVAMIEGDLVGS